MPRMATASSTRLAVARSSLRTCTHSSRLCRTPGRTRSTVTPPGQLGVGRPWSTRRPRRAWSRSGPRPGPHSGWPGICSGIWSPGHQRRRTPPAGSTPRPFQPCAESPAEIARKLAVRVRRRPGPRSSVVADQSGAATRSASRRSTVTVGCARREQQVAGDAPEPPAPPGAARRRASSRRASGGAARRRHRRPTRAPGQRRGPGRRLGQVGVDGDPGLGHRRRPPPGATGRGAQGADEVRRHVGQRSSRSRASARSTTSSTSGGTGRPTAGARGGVGRGRQAGVRSTAPARPGAGRTARRGSTRRRARRDALALRLLGRDVGRRAGDHRQPRGHAPAPCPDRGRPPSPAPAPSTRRLASGRRCGTARWPASRRGAAPRAGAGPAGRRRPAGPPTSACPSASGPTREPVGEVALVGVRHHQEGAAVLQLAGVVDRDDVRRLDLAQEAPLLHEPLADLVVLGPVVGEHLDGDRASRAARRRRARRWRSHRSRCVGARRSDRDERA